MTTFMKRLALVVLALGATLSTGAVAQEKPPRPNVVYIVPMIKAGKMSATTVPTSKPQIWINWLPAERGWNSFMRSRCARRRAPLL